MHINITLIEIHFGTHSPTVGMAIGPFGTERGSPRNDHFIAFAQRRRLSCLAIDEPHALESAPQGGAGHFFVMCAEPMDQTPHTEVASLPVECAHPLANHRLERLLDAIQRFTFSVESYWSDLSCLTGGAEHLLHGPLAKPERLRHPPHSILRGDRWPLATFLIKIFLQLHYKPTFPPINRLTVRHGVVSWGTSMRHSCETLRSKYPIRLFSAKSCETRYRFINGTLLPDGSFVPERDTDGNALGGLRLPHMPSVLCDDESRNEDDCRAAGAPLGTYTGLETNVSAPPSTNLYVQWGALRAVLA